MDLSLLSDERSSYLLPTIPNYCSCAFWTDVGGVLAVSYLPTPRYKLPPNLVPPPKFSIFSSLFVYNLAKLVLIEGQLNTPPNQRAFGRRIG